jgi:hypothetical protein
MTLEQALDVNALAKKAKMPRFMWDTNECREALRRFAVLAAAERERALAAHAQTEQGPTSGALIRCPRCGCKLRFDAEPRVPREPTEAMLKAAREWSRAKYGQPVGNDAAYACWRAMWDAAASAPRSEGQG